MNLLSSWASFYTVWQKNNIFVSLFFLHRVNFTVNFFQISRLFVMKTKTKDKLLSWKNRYRDKLAQRAIDEWERSILECSSRSIGYVDVLIAGKLRHNVFSFWHLLRMFTNGEHYFSVSSWNSCQRLCRRESVDCYLIDQVTQQRFVLV